MRSKTRRALRITAWLALAMALSVTSYFIYQAYVPKAADFTLDARTERVVLESPNGGPPFSWPGLEVYAVDGTDASCALRSLQFGDDEVRVTVSVDDGSTPASRGRRMTAQAGQWAKLLRIRLERPKEGDHPHALLCVNGEQLQVRKSADLWLRGQVGQTVNLPIYAKVLVGGIVDPQGGPMALLRSGTLQASARLKGSPYLPVSNQIELHPGDEVQVMPDSDARESLSVGVMRFDGNDLELVTHARGAFAVLRRAGLGAPEAFSLRPGLLALIQSNPIWGVITLVCAVVSGILGLLTSGKTGENKQAS